MNVRDYLSKLPENVQVTFVVQRSVKAEGPFWDYLYRTTPIKPVWDWRLSGEAFLGQLVVNADHPPIDVTGLWGREYRDGRLRCAMIAQEAGLLNHYGPEQGRRLIEYYHREVKMKEVD